MARKYKCLPELEFTNGVYKLVSIRNEDKDCIMKWRNEQINILRQKEALTYEKQNLYFKNVVDKLFEKDEPEQLLFGFLENDILIGYGGLVHIDWESKNAEVSFITETSRNNDASVFTKDFKYFLNLLFRIAFDSLKFIKLHTTFYDIDSRVHYKSIIQSTGFIEEGKLKNHILIDGRIETVLIYSYFNKL